MSPVVLVAVLVAAGVVAALIVRRLNQPHWSPTQPGQPVPKLPRSESPTPAPPHITDRLAQMRVEAQVEARNLARGGKVIQAIKLIRTETGLGLKEAKEVGDALKDGALLPSRSAPSDLASRVRQMKRDGRTEHAVFLVRGETGMSEAEATSFVAQL